MPNACCRFTESWRENLDENKKIVSIFMDFSNAFLSVHHDTLLEELKSIGFNESTIRWTLKDRIQYVLVNGVRSTWLHITHRLPQGSSLRHTLFNIYISDLWKLVSSHQNA